MLGRASILFVPIENILALLIAERDTLNRAIEVLQGTKRLGRPAKNAVASTRTVTSNGRGGMDVRLNQD